MQRNKNNAESRFDLLEYSICCYCTSLSYIIINCMCVYRRWWNSIPQKCYNLIPLNYESQWQFVHKTGPQYWAPECIVTPFHLQCVWNEVSEEEDEWLTWKLRNTVSRLKNPAMAEKPNMRRGLLPIRSITKPWGQDRRRQYERHVKWFLENSCDYKAFIPW